MEKEKVLFVCIHNSARSQMAEAYLSQFGRGRFEAESAGIEPGYVIVDIPEKPHLIEMRAQVLINGRMTALDKASSLVAALEKAQTDNWRLGVFTPAEYREKVGKIAREFFEVKKDIKQFRLTEI